MNLELPYTKQDQKVYRCDYRCIDIDRYFLFLKIPLAELLVTPLVEALEAPLERFLMEVLAAPLVALLNPLPNFIPLFWCLGNSTFLRSLGCLGDSLSFLTPTFLRSFGVLGYSLSCLPPTFSCALPVYCDTQIKKHQLPI